MSEAKRPLPTSAQIRAARAWLQITQDAFVEETGVPKRTLARLEIGGELAYGETLERVRDALERLGVELLFEEGRAAGIRVADRPRVASRPRRVRKDGQAGRDRG